MSFELILNSCLETLYMVFTAGFIAIALGLPLGIFLFISQPGQILEQKIVHQILGLFVNISRSIPFIILLVALIPFTRLIVGSSIGTSAAIVPLSLAAVPFFARLVEGAMAEVPKGLCEYALSLGANSFQITTKILIPEALPGIISSITTTLVNLIAYSAMAGTVGGGGLGDFAIRYGYQRFDAKAMLLTVFILVVIVQLIQFSGDYISSLLRKSS